MIDIAKLDDSDANRWRKTVNIEEIREKYFPNDATSLPVRDCSLCGSSIGYVTDGVYLYFDSNCDCVSYTTLPKIRDWSELENMN